MDEEFVKELERVYRLKIDVITRWNSIFNMLQRLVILAQPVDMWFAQHDRESELRLTPEDWRVVGDIIDILGIFKPLTVALQA